MGAFAEFGWAWNIKPSAAIVGRLKAAMPSAEFTESAVICAYGASNVFMEHLGGWGQAWTATDLEHVSITVMFFGGGLVSRRQNKAQARRRSQPYTTPTPLPCVCRAFLHACFSIQPNMTLTTSS